MTDSVTNPSKAFAQGLNSIGVKYIDTIIQQMESQKMKVISLEDMYRIRQAVKTGDFSK